MYIPRVWLKPFRVAAAEAPRASRDAASNLAFILVACLHCKLLKYSFPEQVNKILQLLLQV